MKVLALGGAGFVIGAFVNELLADEPNYEVVVADIALPSPDAQRGLTQQGRVTFIEGDVTDLTSIADTIRRLEPQIVVHGAALTSPGESELLASHRYLNVNSAGALNVALAACRAKSVRRFVFISSGSVYGPYDLVRHEPMRPDQASTSPTSAYGITKLAGELLARRICELEGVPFVALRLSNVFGPLEYANPSRMTISVPTRIVRARLRGERLRVTPRTLEATSDWISSIDVGRAIASACISEGPLRPAYNVASGFQTSVEEIFTLARAEPDTGSVADGFEIDMEPGALNPEFGSAAQYDIRETLEDLSWAPRALDLQFTEFNTWAHEHESFYR